jgi:hypothetical protein
MMIARFEGNVKSCAASRTAGIGNCVHLGMRPPEHFVEALADNGPILYQDRSDEGIRAGPASSPRRQAKGFFHVQPV